MSFTRFLVYIFARSANVASLYSRNSVGLGIKALGYATNLMVLCMSHSRCRTCVASIFNCMNEFRFVLYVSFMYFYCSYFNAAKLLFIWCCSTNAAAVSTVKIVKSLTWKRDEAIIHIFLPTFIRKLYTIRFEEIYNDLWFWVMMTWYNLKWYEAIFETRKILICRGKTHTISPNQRRIH